MEISMEVPQKIKIKQPYDPATPLLGLCLKTLRSAYNGETCTPMIIVTLFTIAKLWNQPTCPSVEEQMRKMWHTYTAEYF
jgi:hypothetical protein